MDTIVRTASESDRETLVALLAALFAIESDFRPDAARQRRGIDLLLAARDRCQVLVAEHAGAVVGMATAQLMISTAEGGLSVLVEDVVVREHSRRLGIGRALLRAIEQWAAERGATRLQLLADVENAPASAFYSRMGWCPTRLSCWARHPG